MNESAISMEILQPEKKQLNIRLRNRKRHSSVLETFLKHRHWLPHCLIYKTKVCLIRAFELEAFQKVACNPITLM